MRTVCALLLAIVTGSQARVAFRLGAEGGFPQMAAVACQYTPWECTTFEAFAGSFFINGTLGARLIVSRTSTGFSPRAFVGGCLVDAWYGNKPEDPMGTSGYLWTGAGIGWNFPCGASLFGDLGWLNGGDEFRGFGSKNSMAISGGILFPL